MSITTELDTMTHIHANLAATLQQQGLTALLPAHVTEEQFTRTAATAMVANADLQRADKQSLVLALTRCARDGLLPDGREAALVVRGGKVGYEPMIDGVLKRARQSGLVANIIAKVVYAGDEFDYVIDEHGEHLTHRPAFIAGADILKVYAFARLTSGEIVVEVMPKSEVDKVRTASKAGNGASAPWNAWYDRMALKTVTKRLARRLPNASELFSLLEVGRDVTEGEKSVYEAVQAHTAPRLRDMLRRRTATGASEALQPTVGGVSARRLTHEDSAKSPEGDLGLRTTESHEKEISTANGEVDVRRPSSEDSALKSKKEGGQQAGTGDAIRMTDITDAACHPDGNDSANPSPQLEALLNALDDTTDEMSCSEVVNHCAKVADSLTDDEKSTLRAKISATKARLAYRASGGKVTIIPFTNASQTAWRFPDGTTETSSRKAEQRAKALNMRLEERQRGRFSASH